MLWKRLSETNIQLLAANAKLAFIELDVFPASGR
jgi:hypothetical protein